jgi:hypothetical protein
MAVVGYTKLEKLFKNIASLELKKGHAKDITDIVEEKLVDLLIAGERNANINGRDVINEGDLPITKGLQETIIYFRKLEEEIEIDDILKFLTTIPPLKYPVSVELEQKLPEIVGAILVVIAKVLKEVENNKLIDHKSIEKTKRIMDLTL